MKIGVPGERNWRRIERPKPLLLKKIKQCAAAMEEKREEEVRKRERKSGSDATP